MDMLNNWTVGIISQCIHMSNHHAVPFKHITILFFNYTSIKPEKSLKNRVTPLLGRVTRFSASLAELTVTASLGKGLGTVLQRQPTPRPAPQVGKWKRQGSPRRIHYKFSETFSCGRGAQPVNERGVSKSPDKGAQHWAISQIKQNTTTMSYNPHCQHY